MVERQLSAAEKKTIEFGLAVAVLTSGPRALEALDGTSGDPSREQRASKQLRLWQGACLGGLVEVGSGTRPKPKTQQQQRGVAIPGGTLVSPRNGVGDRGSAVSTNVGWNQRGDPHAVAAGCFASGADESMRRLLASDAVSTSDLRVLGTVAISGGHSEGARAVQKEALEGIWNGDCSPSTVSLFAKEMLEQVVLCGQGAGSGQVYRHVLDLMISIVDEVAEAACLVAAANANATMSRQLDVALAVSQAFDATLVKLARGLRGGIRINGSRQGLRGDGSNSTGGGGSGERQGSLSTSARHSRRHTTPQQFQSTAALARAAGAGLFLDAYESVVAGLCNTFRHLSLAEKDGSADDDGGSEALRSSRAPWGNRRSSSLNGPSFRSSLTCGERHDARNRPTLAMSGSVAAKGGMGWDAEVRRNAWTQRKLEVLAEATTAMSSFPMGQLRLQRVVCRVYECARVA